jgi:hypothetical protein
MSKRPGAKPPKPDPTDQALLALTEVLLDNFFADADNADIYEALFGPDGRKLPGGQPLGEIALSNGGVAMLSAEPQRERFRIGVTHPKFTANMVARYEIDRASVTQERVTAFSGDRRAARNAADAWSEELNETGLEDLLDRFSALDDDDEDEFEPPDLGEDPGEPPAPTAADAARVAEIVRDAAADLEVDETDLSMSPFDSLWFEQSPQTLWPLLDQTIDACNADPRDDTLVGAYLFLLGNQLELIRFRVEAGWEWAERMVEQYQQRMIELGRSRQVSAEDWFHLVKLLAEARIEVAPAMREAMAEAGLSEPDAASQGEMLGMIRGLLDRMADAVDSPFDVVSGFSDATQVMPEGLRSFIVHELALSEHAVLRDVVPLMLLDAEPAVRQAAALALDQIAAPETLSPASLRRMIAVRNWLPEAERPTLDKAIRKARTKGVECAQWPRPADIVLVGTAIDGSGAQSFVVGSRGRGKGVGAGVLVKMGVGIRDCWADEDASRSEINSTLSELRRQTPCSDTERAHLDTAIQHAIGVGTANATVPPPAFVRFAELVGGAEWRDRRLDITAEARRMFESFDPAERSADAVAESLQRSGRWLPDEAPFAESWFEDSAAVRAAIGRAPRRDRVAAARLVMQEVLPEQRPVWAERLLFMALWARAAKDKGHHARWRDFAVLAAELSGDRPLEDVPFMRALAEKTVVIARRQPW